MSNQSSNGFDIDERAANALNQGMALGGGIELPFEAPVFWWMNGAPSNRALGQTFPAMFYGGWACDKADLDAVADERGGIPGGLVETEIFTRESKTVLTYTSRMLILAPIGFRQSWYSGNGQSQARSTQYAPGLRQHIQVLALMGIKNPEGKYRSWGPITLSCKGYQANYLTSALKDWKKTLERPRKEHCPAVPAWAFWMAAGTYGDLKTQMVGKTGAQSPITPVNLYIPKDITLETMHKLYVGKEGVSEMATLLDEAGEWLNAWKQRSNGHAGAPSGEAGMEDDYIPPEPTYEDDVPF